MSTTASYRAIRLPAVQQLRAILAAILGGALVFFVFEASKSAIFPHLTIWESHSITIGFGAMIAGAAAWITIGRQARVLAELAAGQAARERLEMRTRVLRESEARYRQLVEQSPQAIAVLREGYIIYANAAAAALIGVDTAAGLLDRRAIDFVHADDVVRVQQRALEPRSSMQYRLVRLDGELREVEAVAASIVFEGADARQIVFRDVTEQRALEARLRHEAFHDALTGLANRALFRDRLQHALTVRRGVAPSSVAVLFLDLDDFKGVNDSLGHEAGDQLLQALAERLRGETRAADTVARFGGDEFAVLIEQAASESEVLAVVNRIKVTLRRPLMLSGRLLSASASVGVAMARPGDDVDTLLRNADVAMYEAKEAGKSRHAVFEPAMFDAIVRRLQLEADLRTASSAPEAAGLFLAYQPIVCLETGRVRSLEALLRWHHPVRGIIPPAVFVPVAEHTGVIEPIGAWVLEQACRQLMRWRTRWWRERRDMTTLPSISVNISGRQLSEERFTEQVREILQRTTVPPELVTLEITESVIMRDTETTLRTLSALKAIGLRLAIDDFGTGYSSLSYLQRFPVDVLKIDRAFVDGVAKGGSDTALARTIVTLGETLGLRTVAEGIEDSAQHDALRRMGCQDGQGFLFSQALGASEITDWLVNRPDLRSLSA